MNDQNTVHYGFLQTRLGTAALAATARGLCALAFTGADEAARTAWLDDLRRVAGADLREDLIALSAYSDALTAFLDGSATAFDPPLDVLDGTPFQREVWEQLRRTDAGEVLTYGDLARRMGRDGASARAVGLACARNRIALAIPCHRVLRADGGLGGYRWGVASKSDLLALESARLKTAL